MYITTIKPENTYYKTHQKVCEFDPNAIWSIVENTCYIRSYKGENKENYNFKEGDEIFFAFRFNGIKRSGNFETPLIEEELLLRVETIFSDSVQIIDMRCDKERPFYMEEKKHKFYPWFVYIKANLIDKDSFLKLVSTGIGRSKRLGFGMIII